MQWVGVILSIIIVGFMSVQFQEYDATKAAIERVVLQVYLEG